MHWSKTTQLKHIFSKVQFLSKLTMSLALLIVEVAVVDKVEEEPTGKLIS